MSDSRRALFMMAHPDDTEILTGGTLLHLADRGWELGILTMTAGDCGSVSYNKRELSRIRYEEASEAAASVDGWYECAGMTDMEVFANEESIRRSVELMRRFGPDVILTHSPADYLTDHEETARLARSAAFATAMPLYETGAAPPAEPSSKTPALYYADPVEGVDAMGRRVPPQFYVDIGDQIDRKADLLAHHESQREWLREHHGMDKYLEEMKRFGRLYGSECGLEYAEGYRQHRGHGYPRELVLQEQLGELVRAGSAPGTPDWVS